MGKCVRQVVLYFLLGAVSTVIVAWSITYSVSEWIHWEKMQQGGKKQIDIRSEAQVWSYQWTDSLTTRLCISELRWWGGLACPDTIVRDTLPDWGNLSSHDTVNQIGIDGINGEYKVVKAADWLRLALYSVTLHQETQSGEQWVVHEGAIRLQEEWAYPEVIADTKVLPLIPIWPGFLWNTLLYEALWWFLLSGIRRLIMFRRRRKGCCTSCGYQLLAEQAVCPECGQGAESLIWAGD